MEMALIHMTRTDMYLLIYAACLISYYLCIAGMTNPQIRGMICSLKPEIEISQTGDVWEFKMITPQSTRVTSFTNGQEIDTTSIVGKPVKVC